MNITRINTPDPVVSLYHSVNLLAYQFMHTIRNKKVAVTTPGINKIRIMNPELVPKDATPVPEETVANWFIRRARTARTSLHEALNISKAMPEVKDALTQVIDNELTRIELHFQIGWKGALWGDSPQIGLNKVRFEDYGEVGTEDFKMEPGRFHPTRYVRKYAWRRNHSKHPDPKWRVNKVPCFEERIIPCGDSQEPGQTPRERETERLLKAMEDAAHRQRFVDNLDPNDYVEDYTELPWYDPELDPDDGHWPRIKEVMDT